MNLFTIYVYTDLPRFLDAYEKYNYLGEREEEDGNMFYDEEDSRARRQRQQKIVTSVPSVYNEAQHRVTGSGGKQLGDCV